MCWHKWKLISAEHFIATYWNDFAQKDVKQDKTCLLYRCDKCLSYMTKVLKGIWNMETLLKDYNHKNRKDK